MNKTEFIRRDEQATRLMQLGFTEDEAEALRRISTTLRRWYELECGDCNDYSSWAIERDEDDIPYMVRHYYRIGEGRITETRIPDREKGAIRRLKKIIVARNTRHCMDTARATYPEAVSYYLQTDPCGAALYILRPGDIPAGEDVSAYYNRGLCVY